MSQFHSLLVQIKGTSSRESKVDSTVKAASAISEHIFHHELTTQQKKIAGPAVHYIFGASMGAVYGTFLEIGDFTHTGWGVPFGAAVWLGAHVITCATYDDFVAALKSAKETDRTTVIYIRNDRYVSVPGYESWWDVPVAEVSDMQPVNEARKEWEEMRAKERSFL